MNAPPQSAVHWFLVAWALSAAFAVHIWFYRLYDLGFKYQPGVLRFEFRISKLVLAALGVIGFFLFERLRMTIAMRFRVFFRILIILTATFFAVDGLISLLVPPFTQPR